MIEPETAVAPAPAARSGDDTVGGEAVDAALPGLATRRSRTSRTSQAVTLVAVIAPAGGVLSAAGVLWGVALRPLDVVLFAVLYVATGLGITVGYHRLFTHKAFEAVRPVRVALAVLGAMTLQGPVTQWATDHRKHHARSDVAGDPHSPHLSGGGLAGTLRGLWHAHVGWMFSTKGMERGDAWGRDLYEDRAIVVVDRLYLVWVALSVAIPFLVAYGLTDSAARGVEALVWAGLVRIFAFEHATFAVNSICHTIGRRAYDARDESRNNWVVAVLTFGEGWHNNHHAFPRSARHGLERLEVDASYLVISALSRLGLASHVKVPTEVQRRRAALARSPAC